MADPADTICALSTVPGRSGLAVVRVSGKNCRSIYRTIFKSRSSEQGPSHREAVLGLIVDPDQGCNLDEAVAIHYFSPNSYTGEDMTEYSIHGNPVLIAALLDGICNAGARIAEPGEFTMRA
ncbi:MAG: tRNA uridine-5-carboxymethylaminomethyl(34) synthesis GTPase MnmE, partial [Acidobacteriota bacterium]